VCQPDPRATTGIQSSVASTICSCEADGASPLAIVLPTPAVLTCIVSADGETPSMEGDPLNLSNIASSELSPMDLPMDSPDFP
jgi:hypothetical protein